MATNVRGVGVSNVDDVMKLFPSYDGARDAATEAGAFIGGLTKPQSIRDIIAESIGAVQQKAAIELMPASPMTPGITDVGPLATTGDTSLAMPPGAGQSRAASTSATPQPNLRGLPTPPSVMDALPVPVFDEKGAQKDRDKGVQLATLFPALATLFNIGGGSAARAAGPGWIAQALAGADAGTKERYGRQLQTFGLQQDTQTLQDQRTQRRYGQDADVIQEANRNAELAYNNVEGARRADLADAARMAGINQKGAGARLRAQASSYKTLLTMTPAAQEAALTADGAEEKYGVLPTYKDGNYVPLRIQKDVTNQQNADTQELKAKNQITVANGNLMINGRRASVYEQNLKRMNRLTDAQIEHYQNADDNAKASLDLAAQRVQIYRDATDAAIDRGRAAIKRLEGGKGDPVKEARNYTKDISGLRARQSQAKRQMSEPFVDDEAKATYQRQIEEDEKAIRGLASLRTAALEEAVGRGTITETTSRSVQGLPPRYGQGPGDTKSAGARFNESNAPALMPARVVLDPKPLPKSLPTMQRNNKKKTAAPKSIKSMSNAELLRIMAGGG